MTTGNATDVRQHATAVRTARDVVLLLARIGLGVMMFAHAKLEYDFAGGSVAGVGQLFAQSGIPLPAITGPANVLFESSAASR
jgi:putative oxidoreductase